MRTSRSYFIRLGFSLYAILYLFLPDPMLAADVKMLSWTKKATYPHDPQAFTQGLSVWGDGTFLESTGQNGASTIRRVDLKSGKVLAKLPLDNEYFGEGSTLFGTNIFQITWKNGQAFVYDWSKKGGFVRKATFNYTGDGWGLTADDKQLYMSNGSSQIQVIDPKTFKVTRKFTVSANGKEQVDLNELEFVRGKIFANVWRSQMILRIDPVTGNVDGIVDLSALRPKEIPAFGTDAVLNGIAWDPKKQLFYVTGKLWPELFAIEIEGYK